MSWVGVGRYLLYSRGGGGARGVRAAFRRGVAKKEKAGAKKYTFPNRPDLKYVRKNYNINALFFLCAFFPKIEFGKVYLSKLAAKSRRIGGIQRMHVRKRIFAFLFAALAMALLTACGKWDYSREAMKAANDAQGENVRVTFEIDQKFTSSLRGAAEDNIQPADVKNAMAMDKTIEKLLTSGYRLDIYALRADTDAAKAAAQLADEFVSRLAGCEEKGYISMVKADNGYFYEAVLVYRHSGNGGAGAGSGSDSDHPDDEGSDDPTDDDEEEKPYEGPWVTLQDGTLTFWPGASVHIGSKLQDDEELISTIEEALKTQGQLTGEFSFSNVKHLVVRSESGIKTIGKETFHRSTELKSIDLEGVTEIQRFAFARCSSLASIKLTDVETIRERAFLLCSSLSGTLNRDILPKIKMMEDAAFGQTNFIEVDLPTVVTLGGFISCSNLKSVNASNATEILSGTFQSCSSRLYHHSLTKKRRPPTLPHRIAVPSAQAGLTSLFGMGRGGTPPQ